MTQKLKAFAHWRVPEGRIFQSKPQTCQDIFSCIFQILYLNKTIFPGNLCCYNRNYFLTTAYEITTSFITAKLCHPKHATCIACDSSGTPMPNEISSMGKTKGNTNLICKKYKSHILTTDSSKFFEGRVHYRNLVGYR
jgi:hypothetical protein